MGQAAALDKGSAPCCLRELRPRTARPAAQAPDSREPGHTAQDPALPPGKAEVGRAQESEDSLPSGAPKLCRSAHLAREHPGQCGLEDWETVVVTGGADSRAGELAATSVVVPPGVTSCLERQGC